MLLYIVIGLVKKLGYKDNSVNIGGTNTSHVTKWL